ncbi:MAG TPA: hypothetical protein VMU66_03100, partial [Gaiellales bacterium]|nr:hypothetical protein [Gaiellales bacterium]
VRMWTSGPGTYLLRVRYTPYWEPSGAGVCADAGPNGMTRVHTPYGGAIALQVSPGLASMALQLAGSTPSRAC